MQAGAGIHPPVIDAVHRPSLRLEGGHFTLPALHTLVSLIWIDLAEAPLSEARCDCLRMILRALT